MHRRLVGRLIRLSHRLFDVAYTVSVVSQFMQTCKDVHLHAVYQILQHLKVSLEKVILFGKGTSMELEAYMDADYAGSVTDRRSKCGYCTFLGGTFVSWRSKKQPVVARSSAKSSTFQSSVSGQHSGRSPSASTAPPSSAVGTLIAASEDSGQAKYINAPGYVNPLSSLSCNMLPNDQTTSGSSQLSLSSPAITPTSPGSSAFLQPPVPGLSASAGPSFSYNISQAAVCFSSSQQLQSRMNAATNVAQESSSASSAPSPSHSVSQSAHTTSIPASLKPSFIPTTFWTPTASSFQMPPGVPGTLAMHGTTGIVPSVPQLSDMTQQSVSVNSSSVQSRPTVPFVPGPSNSALQQHTYSSYPSVLPLAVLPQGLWLQPPQMSGSSRPSLLPYLASFSAPFPLSTHGMPLPSVLLPDSQPPGVTPVVFPGGTSTSSAASGNQQAVASGVHPEVPPGIDSCEHVDSGMVKDGTPVSEQLDAWTAHRTGTGAVYYYNALTGESTYEKPSGFIGEGPAERTKCEVMELFFSDSRLHECGIIIGHGVLGAEEGSSAVLNNLAIFVLALCCCLTGLACCADLMTDVLDGSIQLDLGDAMCP
ncbi:hypothetical protein RJ639_047792 [Escallonia herrerae]|uniref:WW domain-containing protein n=1 Tax=Escallonia herrerae TaxID=1293975 RepID=A0AA89AZV9_9ASTE|nr:hypothetical protein RJ639_047792 [Escallonia herrerae]